MHVGDASTSDCRFNTHSNVGTVAFCLDVSKRDFDPARAMRKRETSRSYSDTHDGEAERTSSADGRGIGDFSRLCLLKQDLAVSDHGRTGRYHVLRTERGVEAGFLFQRCRSRSVQPPASVCRSAEYALTSRTFIPDIADRMRRFRRTVESCLQMKPL